EKLRSSGRRGGFTCGPPLCLDGVPARDAISRIVAHDSRYEWSEDGGVFRVRPKVGTPGRSDVLDRTLPSFVRTGQPTVAVLEGLISNISTQPRSPATTSSQPTNLEALKAIAIRPIDVSFPGTVAARDVLDALSRAAGPVSWVLRSYVSMTDGWTSHVLQLVTPDGIAVSESFGVSSGTVPTHPPEHPLPPAFAQINIGT